MLHENTAWKTGTEKPSYLSTYHRYSYATPYLKTHVAGEYTNTHSASALMLRQANT